MPHWSAAACTGRSCEPLRTRRQLPWRRRRLGTGGVDSEHVLELLCQTPVAQAQVRPDPPGDSGHCGVTPGDG